MDIPASYVSYERGFFPCFVWYLNGLNVANFGLARLAGSDKGAIWSWWLSIIPA